MASPRVSTRKVSDLIDTTLSDSPIESPLIKSSKSTHAPIDTDIYQHAYSGNTRSVLSMLDRKPELIIELGKLPSSTEVLYASSTILHFACRADHRHLAFELVKRGADIYALNQVQDIPLTYCNATFREQLIQLFEKVEKA